MRQLSRTASGAGAIFTGGLSLLGWADYYLKQQTLKIEILRSKKHALYYSTHKRADGTVSETGTIFQFVDTLRTALGG